MTEVYFVSSGNDDTGQLCYTTEQARDFIKDLIEEGNAGNEIELYEAKKLDFDIEFDEIKIKIKE